MKRFVAAFLFFPISLSLCAHAKGLSEEERACYAAASAFTALDTLDEATLTEDGFLFFPADSYHARFDSIIRDEWWRLIKKGNLEQGSAKSYSGFSELIEREAKSAEQAWADKADTDLESLIERALACRPAGEELAS